MEFNQNEQEGIKMGGSYSGGDRPGLDIILTKNQVYCIHEDTRDILMQEHIPFETQWYDQDGEPVGEDDPTKSRGEPTAPEDGAVDETLQKMKDKMSGFSSGWNLRHNSGPEYDNLQEYADDLAEVHNVREIVKVNGPNREIEVQINIPNSSWGLPGEVYRWVDDHPTLEIVDFKNISEDSVTIILDYDSSRASRW